MNYGYQLHGYKNGHQCLFSNIILNTKDQDAIDRLSDISGALKPGEIFDPYLTCYPLPSHTFFVLARTWQDLKAPRAGCVITKSIIVPMAEWLDNINATQNLNLLFAATSDKDEPITFSVSQSNIGNFPINESQEGHITELIEAVFLEKRQPILCFNVSGAEAIAYRLYSVFWRKLRSSFAICTYALSQRTVDGRLFDLLFAPLSAKPRFSEWNGRRIEGAGAAPRHKWTLLLTNSIFKDSYPCLPGKGEALPVNISNIDFDDNSLRLNLLWEELYQNAHSDSPFLPILGLLDILNSSASDANTLRTLLDPLIYLSISLVDSKLAPLEAWTFLTSLALRYKRKLMQREMYTKLTSACEHLSRKDPISALSFLANYKRSLETVPALLFKGIGDGIYYYFITGHFLDLTDFVKLPQIAIQLTAFSKLFVRLIIEQLEADKKDWEIVIDCVVSNSFNQLKVRAITNIANYISFNTPFRIVDKLITSCDSKTFEVFIKIVLQENNFKTENFNSTILRNAIRLNEEDYLYKLLIQYDLKGNDDSLLTSLLVVKANLLIYFCWEDEISNTRKLNILSALYGKPYENSLSILVNDRSVSQRVLSIIGYDKKYEFARSIVLIVGNFPIDFAIAELNKISQITFDQIGVNRVAKFLHRISNNGPLSLTNSITQFLSRVESFDYDQVLRRATENALPTDQVLTNINLLFKINTKFSTFLLERINIISLLFAQNLNDETITTGIADHWADLLNQAKPYKIAQKEASVAMLDFSFRCTIFDPTQLIIVSFPIVYKSFLKNKPIANFLPMIFFSDWDKCKTLREDLVRLYLRKSWSILGLLYVAMATNILKEVIHILLDKNDGKKILDTAMQYARDNAEYGDILYAISELL